MSLDVFADLDYEAVRVPEIAIPLEEKKHNYDTKMKFSLNY